MLVNGTARLVPVIEDKDHWWREPGKREFEPIDDGLCVATITKVEAFRLYVYIRIITGPSVAPFEIDLHEPKRGPLSLWVSWDAEGVLLGQTRQKHTTLHPWLTPPSVPAR